MMTEPLAAREVCMTEEPLAAQVAGPFQTSALRSDSISVAAWRTDCYHILLSASAGLA